VEHINRHRWLLIGVVLLIVGVGIGYGVARFTTSTAALPTPPAAEPEKNADSMELPEAFLATMGIGVEIVTPGSLSTEVQASGTVTAAANGQAIVTARASGTVMHVVKRLGDPVIKGEVLALIDSSEAAALAAERTTAESKLELARSILKREQSLYEQKITPRQDWETAQAQLAAAQAEATRAERAAEAAGVANDGRAAIVSPLTGRITAANITLGAHATPDMELFRVADPRFVLIQAPVSAIDAQRVHVDALAKVVTGSGKELDAKVTSVTPTLDEQTRAATVSLSLISNPSGVTPGELVQVRIAEKINDAKSYVLPDEAVQNINGREIVFVRTSKGFTVTPVIVGARSSGRAVILSGLHQGEVVATKNAFLLKAEIGKGADEEE